MGFRTRRIILIAFVVAVVDYASAQVQPADRRTVQPAAAPVRAQNGEVVIETRVEGPLYYAAGTLRGQTGSSITPQRMVIPVKQVQSLTIYEVKAVLQCNGQGLCNPCGPKTCLNPPAPPPPPIALRTNLLTGFMLPPSGPRP